jgi:MFS family permease
MGILCDLTVMGILCDLTESVSAHIGWPAWALAILAVLSLMVAVLSGVQTVLVGSTVEHTKQAKSSKRTAEFRWFQLQYLGVYLTIMLADWLQGTNMYTLYSVSIQQCKRLVNGNYPAVTYTCLLQSYGVNVSSLFLTGFLSSAVFGTFLGIYVDTYGRRLGCIVFCLLEIVINLIEHVPNMNALLFGRILGGMSTSLLFTSFESWMVSEHRKRGFDESWLASTFSIASWGNGFGAIIAGVLAQVAAGRLL